MKNNLTKIAVIANGRHYHLGGTEKYSATCYQDWISKYEVVEFPAFGNNLNEKHTREQIHSVKIDESLLGLKPYSILWAKTFPRKKMQKIYQNYDLVILNVVFPPRKWINHPKSILVQHMHDKWYTMFGKNWKLSLGQFFVSLLFGVGTITNAFKKAHNVVFYTDEAKAATKAKNVFFIPLAHKKLEQIKIEKKNCSNFAFIGRLENHQKNIADLIKIANINDDVLIYGKGDHQKMVQRKLKNLNQYKGVLTKQEIDKTIQNLKCLIVTSHHEGFSYIIVEALSNGTPVIAFHSFKSLDFFVKSEAVFLIKPGDIDAFNEKIAWLRNLSAQEYEKISENAVNFARKHLTQEVFWEKWQKALQKVICYNKNL